MHSVCIFGAGQVGCYVGARLAHAGNAVRLVGRAPALDALRRHGLDFSDYLGARGHVDGATLQLSQTPDAAAGADLVLVCVKSGDTDAAAAQLAAVLSPGAVVASLQNGVGNAERLARLLPGQVVLAGMVPFNVVPLGDGRFHQATEGALQLQRHPDFEAWANIFARAGLPVGLHEDMAPLLWGKLLLNLANPVNALSGLPVQAMLAQRAYRRCVALAQAEAIALMRAAHLRPARMTPLPPAWTPRLLGLPDAIFLRLARRMLEIDPHARSSMSYDLERGRPGEVDWLNGEIVRLAQTLGRGAPVNARLVALMHGAEAGGRRQWGATALLAELQRAAG